MTSKEQRTATVIGMGTGVFNMLVAFAVFEDTQSLPLALGAMIMVACPLLLLQFMLVGSEE